MHKTQQNLRKIRKKPDKRTHFTCKKRLKSAFVTAKSGIKRSAPRGKRKRNRALRAVLKSNRSHALPPVSTNVSPMLCSEVVQDYPTAPARYPLFFTTFSVFCVKTAEIGAKNAFYRISAQKTSVKSTNHMRTLS